MNTEVTVENRLNNVIFKCLFEDKYYSNKKSKAFALTEALGLVQTPDGKTQISMKGSLACEACFVKYQKDFDFQELPQIERPSLKDTLAGRFKK